MEQARYDGPEIDESITGAELDRSVLQHLKGLPDKLAARVARHLVAAGTLLDTDPETAYQHTLAARARAARIAVVREACGEAAYAAGHYAEALAELRAAKRINGAQDYLPVMADCERALGRPDKALDLARNPAVARLDPALKAEMTIVEAGARRDLGQLDAALRTLEQAPLRSQTRADMGGPAPLRLRRHPAGRRPHRPGHRMVPPHHRHRPRPDHRRRHPRHPPRDPPHHLTHGQNPPTGVRWPAPSTAGHVRSPRTTSWRDARGGGGRDGRENGRAGR